MDIAGILVVTGTDHLHLAAEAGIGEAIFWGAHVASLPIGIVAAVPVNPALVAAGVTERMRNPAEKWGGGTPQTDPEAGAYPGPGIRPGDGSGRPSGEQPGGGNGPDYREPEERRDGFREQEQRRPDADCRDLRAGRPSSHAVEHVR